MLHAELHGKLDPASPDLERREDILTSTVFGTLLVAGADDLLAEWLGRARRLTDEGELRPEPLLPESSGVIQWWFWPSLLRTEPDLLLRIGSKLLVIEAKYGAVKGQVRSLSDSDGDSSEILADQIVRQWRSVDRRSLQRQWYPRDIQRVIEECEPTLVYLVSSRRRERALRELRESRLRILTESRREPTLRLLTWQDLHAVLKRRLTNDPRAAKWIRDLAGVLERRRLAGFLGFTDAPPPAPTDAPIRWARDWQRKKMKSPFEILQEIDFEQLHIAKWRVEAWRDSQRSKPSLHQRLPHLDLSAIRVVATLWGYGKRRFSRSDIDLRATLEGLDLTAIRGIRSHWRFRNS